MSDFLNRSVIMCASFQCNCRNFHQINKGTSECFVGYCAMILLVYPSRDQIVLCVIHDTKISLTPGIKQWGKKWTIHFNFVCYNI